MTDQLKRERDRLIHEYYRLIDENRALAAKNAGVTERQPVIAEAHRFLQAYFGILPRVQMSRCPFTNKPLVLPFDPWGTDGFWWQEKEITKTLEPEPPETFRVLRGALSLNGLPPLGGAARAPMWGPTSHTRFHGC